MKFKIIASVLAMSRLTLARRGSPEQFATPASDAVDFVNPLIGNGPDSPDYSGGMIPSTAPPFAMTRWVAQTRQNCVSTTPYNYADDKIHGFQGTHQPAIWMGESGPVVVVPGAGAVKSVFEERGMKFSHEDEITTPSYYSASLEAIEGGTIKVEQSATSRVGHLRFTFTDTQTPYILLEASRATSLGPPNIGSPYLPIGSVTINGTARQITGHNTERQDSNIGPNPAPSFAGYFCARFSMPFASWGIASNTEGQLFEDYTTAKGMQVSAYVTFEGNITTLDVRVGVSFISEDQACSNIDHEIPDGTELEETARNTRAQWAEKLDRIQVQGGSPSDLTIFYTAIFHTLQYPYEQSENGRYYSGYDDSIHEGESYSGYSIWDTYRAAWAWQIILAPERIPGMVQSMLQDYQQVGTHADSLISEAVVKGIRGFDLDLAYEAVYKDATVPPEDDWTTSYSDRQQHVGYEVRAGLSSVYDTKGWVANDIHSESASRTLDYAYDDHAVAVLSDYLVANWNSSLAASWNSSAFFAERSKNASRSLFNSSTGFMEARTANGNWAGENEGWTEGNKWIYTFDMVQDAPGLIELKGGKKAFVEFLDSHFDGGHNDHTNEPSHHIPYLYAFAGAASKTQERVREIAKANYNASVDGLSGNEDCGQMSAWYIFSALGFYPVNPVSREYIIGTPFFDKITIDIPNASKQLVIVAANASTKPYVQSVKVNGEDLVAPVLVHDQFINGGTIEFQMSDTPQEWGSQILHGNGS